VVSRFDDWIYWTSVLQLHLVTTVYTLISLTLNLSLVQEFLVSGILILDSVSRSELASSGPEIEHQIHEFIPSLIAVVLKTCVNLGAKL
jgi:hypothetical protein